MDINGIALAVASLGGMGVLFGLGLGYAGEKFKVYEDPNLGSVRDALPGANCGGCGFAGCDAFAAAVCEGKAKPNGCPVGGAESTQKISDILGIKAEIKEKHVSFVKCGGNLNFSNFRYDYYGINDCKAAMQLSGGGAKACSYGCLGCGSCVRACKFDALHIVDGIALVDREKCTACGMCVPQCPKDLLELVPYRSGVRAACNSHDTGKTVRALCKVGCIACKMCEKACAYDAVHVTDNLARIDYSKCVECNECAKKCPTGTIVSTTYKKEKVEKGA